MIWDSPRSGWRGDAVLKGHARARALPASAVFAFLFLLAVAIFQFPTIARAAMAVTDSAAIAKLAQQLNSMRRQMEELVAIKQEAEAAAQALGDAGRVILPAVDLARLGYQLHRDMACLTPNWEGLMPTLSFDEIDLRDICSRRDFYRQTLFAGGEEYGKMSLPEKNEHGRVVAERRTRVDGLARGLPAARDRLTTASQRLDDWSERLARGARGRLAAQRQAVGRLRPLRPRQLLALKRQQLTHAAGRLAADRPTARIVQARQASEALAERLARAGRAALSERAGRVETASRLLESYSYRGVLARGFAVVRDQRERPLTSAAGVKSGTALSLEFHDGRAAARAAGKPKPRTAKSENDGGGQGSLL